MRIFNAIDNAEIPRRFHDKTGIKLNCLIAFDKVRKQTDKLTHDYRGMMGGLYLESGGYGTRIKRAKVTLQRYANYLAEYGHRYDKVFSFDDQANDFGHNFRNLRYLAQTLPHLRDRLIPVLHDPGNYLQEVAVLTDSGFDHVAIATPRKIPDVEFQRIKAHFPGLKVHLLGKLNRQTLFRHRPDSADSAAWIWAASKGIVHFFHPQGQREYRVYAGGRDKIPGSLVNIDQFQYRAELEELLAAKLGYTCRDLVSSTEARAIINLFFYCQLEEHLNGQAALTKRWQSPV